MAQLVHGLLFAVHHLVLSEVEPVVEFELFNEREGIQKAVAERAIRVQLLAVHLTPAGLLSVAVVFVELLEPSRGEEQMKQLPNEAIVLHRSLSDLANRPQQALATVLTFSV